LRAIDDALKAESSGPTAPDIEGFAHRCQRGELVVDALAPRWVDPAPGLGGGERWPLSSMSP
jgi:hypothetical protein